LHVGEEVEMFVRRHYQAIAAAVREARVTIGPDEEYRLYPLEVVEDELVRLFKADNPRFDEAKFRDAVRGRV
jgi:hypothetical protein